MQMSRRSEMEMIGFPHAADYVLGQSATEVSTVFTSSETGATASF